MSGSPMVQAQSWRSWLPGRHLVTRGGARHLIERNVMAQRHGWLTLLSGFFEPVFYLLSIGLGIGALVGDIEVGGRSIPYAQYVAPAMLAASAMNGAIYEATFSVFFRIKYAGTYEAILATPVGPGDVALGEIGWSQMRGGVYAAGFLGVAALMGLVSSPWAILAVPAALLIGFAFAAAGMAATTYMRSWQDFDLVSLTTMPLFLFSATFYPLDVYPPAIQAVTHISPLYHGVVITRGLMLGELRWSMLTSAAVLVVVGLVGLAVAGRRLEKLLLK